MTTRNPQLNPFSRAAVELEARKYADTFIVGEGIWNEARVNALLDIAWSYSDTLAAESLRRTAVELVMLRYLVAQYVPAYCERVDDLRKFKAEIEQLKAEVKQLRSTVQRMPPERR